jgi:hypothetical protein
MSILIFSTTFIPNISHSKKNSVSYNHKCVLVFMQSTHYSCQILIKLEFSQHVFKEHSNINENLFSGSRVVPYGWMDRHTDRQTDMTKLTISFCNFGNTPKKENSSCPDFLATNITSAFLFTVFMFLHNTLTKSA